MNNRGKVKEKVIEIKGVQFIYKVILILKRRALNVVETTRWVIKVGNRGVLIIKTWKRHFIVKYVRGLREN